MEPSGSPIHGPFAFHFQAAKELEVPIIVPLGMCFVIQTVWGLEAWHIWLAIVLGHMTRAALSMIRFRQGKWRHIKVSIGD